MDRFESKRTSRRKSHKEIRDVLPEVLSKEERKRKLQDYFENLHINNLFEKVEVNLETFFRNEITPDRVRLLKEAFINQKRIIRNNMSFNYKMINDLVPARYKHVNNEMKFVCQMVDCMQEVEFFNTFVGPYLSLAYPITGGARNLIITWLSKCQAALCANHNTFQLSVAIFDQYVIRKRVLDQVTIFKLAITSCLIAFKIEEITIPSINTLLEAGNPNVTKEEIIEFEIEVLKTLDFGINLYVPGVFLKIFVLIGEVENYKSVFEMSNLFIDIALADISIAGYPYSFLGATSLCLSEHIMNSENLDENIWKDYRIFLTGIRWQDIEKLCQNLCQILQIIARDVINGSQNVVGYLKFAMIEKYSRHQNISAVFISKIRKIYKLPKTQHKKS